MKITKCSENISWCRAEDVKEEEKKHIGREENKEIFKVTRSKKRTIRKKKKK